LPDDPRGTDAPRILARLRDADTAEQDRKHAPAWARPAGWVLVAAIGVMVIVMAIRANPW